jgi:Tol biopolymer transport system component
VNRPAWQPIILGAKACIDWTIFHSNQSGAWELYRLGDNAGKMDVLNNVSQGNGNTNKADNLSPSRSPDGQWVAFTTNRDGNWEIYIANATGKEINRVTYNTTAADIDPMWSPTGQYVAYESTRQGSRDIYMIDINTGDEVQLTNSPANEVNPFWSPDGSKIVYQSDINGLWQIFQVDVASKQITQLSDGKGNDLNPQYSADGKTIAFRSYRDTMDKSLLYVVNADGTNAKLISDPKANAFNQVWSPDSKMLAYQSDATGNGDIYVYQLGSAATTQVTNTNVPDFAPTWKCDSSTLIFSSADQTGTPKLFQMSVISGGDLVKASDIQQLTFGKSIDQYPLNSPAVEDGSRRGKVGNP